MKPQEIAEILDNKGALDIDIIDVQELTIIADYFVICSGLSGPHIKTLADELEFQLEKKGVFKLRMEGYDAARWIVLDYGDMLVHIFHKDEREYYDIERLWENGTNCERYEHVRAEQ